MVNYLITGGAGFIGGHLVRRLLRDPAARGRFDYVALLAADASVPATVADPVGSTQVNLMANLTLIEQLKAAGHPVRKLFFASSAAVYGDLPGLPKREAAAVAPQSPYAVAKYAAERAVVTSELPAVCGRLFNVYGPAADGTLSGCGVVATAARQLAAGLPFTVHGDGGQSRDFVAVSDVAAVIAGLLHGPAAGVVVNVGTGVATSLNQVLALLAGRLNVPLRRLWGDPRAGDVAASQADVSAVAALGLTCPTALGTGLGVVARAAQRDAAAFLSRMPMSWQCGKIIKDSFHTDSLELGDASF
ncbi:NAD-dependent epimerase/dehydratase family protein [Lacticaseibacillus kribbianus]|uniref:NAD-dependent epimerase/dehydratase family protein n=1 Tax=Lacticaseibacillus kribbianus TaxID=2926292 RepID=UPI001CD7F925|nr:NAD-dependent epimerase/dehydratase family protein [Lacticaseibacillus kribbianus]